MFPPGFLPSLQKESFGTVEKAIINIFNENTCKRNIDTFQFKIQVKKNMTAYVVLCNIPRNM
jgi:hypothetical protein